MGICCKSRVQSRKPIEVKLTGEKRIIVEVNLDYQNVPNPKQIQFENPWW